MYPPGGPRQPELDFEQLMAQLRATMGRINARLGGGGVWLLGIGLVAVIVAIWLATGIYTVSPGENAATRRFGNLCSAILGPCGEGPTVGMVTTEGLKWWWPGPIGKTDVVQVAETRRMELGFRGGAQGAATPVPEEALMISGDLNIIDVRMVVQYNIKSLTDYLFRVADPGAPERGIPEGRPDGSTLKDAAEAAIRLVVGQRSIGAVLAEQRVAIQEDTRTRLQEILDSYGSGINVVSVELQNVQAPNQVRDAFDDVLRARQDKETSINQARGYENQILPEARGQAAQIRQAAQAFRDARIARATGEAEQFAVILEEYQTSRNVTRQRLYLEAMEEILPGISKVIVSPEVDAILLLSDEGGVTPVPVGPSGPSPNPSP